MTTPSTKTLAFVFTIGCTACDPNGHAGEELAAGAVARSEVDSGEVDSGEVDSAVAAPPIPQEVPNTVPPESESESESEPRPPGPPASDGLCPEGMLFVPGGSFTAKQRQRLQQAATLSGAPYADHVDDFCLDRTEVTRAEVASCLLVGPCKQHPGIQADVEGSPFADRKFFEALDDPARHTEPEIIELARQHYHTNGTVAADICTSMGRRLVTTEEFVWAYWGGVKDQSPPWGRDLREFEIRLDELGYAPADVEAVSRWPARWGHIGLASVFVESAAAPFTAQYRFRSKRGSEPTDECESYTTNENERENPCGFRLYIDIYEEGGSPDSYDVSFTRIYSKRIEFRCASPPRAQPAPPRRPLLDTVEFVRRSERPTYKRKTRK